MGGLRVLLAFFLAFVIGEGARWGAMSLGVTRRVFADLILFGTFVLMSLLFRRWFGVKPRPSPYSEPPDPLKLKE